MILKTLTRRSASFGQLLNYVTKENALAPDGKGVLIPWNIQGQTVDEWVKEFQENEKLRQKHHSHNIKLIHTVIALADGDAQHIDAKVLESMALKYISLRGMDARYVCLSHHDTEHPHLHFVESPLTLAGENRRMSIEEFQELKKELQAYQIEQWPELTESVAEHGKKHRLELEASDKEYQIKLRNGTFRREQISEFLKSSLEQTDSMENWFESIRSECYEPYYRGGKLYGVQHEGRRYRFNKLGIDQNRLNELSLNHERENELLDLRDGSREVDRDIEG